MKRSTIVISAIALTLMIAFACIGYAAISGSLNIEGETQATTPNAVFISNITSSSQSGSSATVNSHTLNLINSTVTLNADGSASVTFHVTVYNHTVDYYAFKGVLFTEGDHTYSNENITFTVSGFEIEQRLAPYEYAYIDITFTYDDYNGASESLNSVLDVHFGLAGKEEGTDYETYINAFLSNEKGYGLNDTNGKGNEVLSSIVKYSVLYEKDNIQGGNLKHLINAVNSENTTELTFIYEYISETQINLYTYEAKYNSSSYKDSEITAYKTVFTREEVGSSYTKWGVASSTFSGLAIVKQIRTPAGTSLYVIDIGTWARNTHE